MKYTEYFELIRKWAYDRNIIVGSTKQAQFTKLIEEIAEIDEDPLDGIGDSFVVLAIIAAQFGINLENVEPKYSGNMLLNDLGLLAGCLSKSKPVYDAIAIMHGTLNGFANMHQVSVDDCMEQAWGEIKDRKGKMIDGVFVKESDLP